MNHENGKKIHSVVPQLQRMALWGDKLIILAYCPYKGQCSVISLWTSCRRRSSDEFIGFILHFAAIWSPYFLCYDIKHAVYQRCTDIITADDWTELAMQMKTNFWKIILKLVNKFSQVEIIFVNLGASVCYVTSWSDYFLHACFKSFSIIMIGI